MIPAEPARIWSPASITAFMPEPHILLTVVAGTLSAMPAPTAAWRAGAWPRPAGSTQPKITSSTASGAKAGIGQRCPGRRGAQLRCGHGAQHALEGANRRAACGSDDEMLCGHLGIPGSERVAAASQGRDGRWLRRTRHAIWSRVAGAVYDAVFLRRKRRIIQSPHERITVACGRIVWYGARRQVRRLRRRGIRPCSSSCTKASATAPPNAIGRAGTNARSSSVRRPSQTRPVSDRRPQSSRRRDPGRSNRRIPWSISDLSARTLALKFRAEVLVLGANHAPAVVGCNRQRVIAHDLAQSFPAAARAWPRRGATPRGSDRGRPGNIRTATAPCSARSNRPSAWSPRARQRCRRARCCDSRARGKPVPPYGSPRRA